MSLIVSIVHPRDQDVFKKDQFLARDIVIASFEQSREIVFAVDRHDLLADFIGRAVQRNGEAKLRRAIRQLPDLRSESAFVEMVMCRAPIPRPHGALMIRIARITFSKLASGSPIPMKTMLSIFWPFFVSTADQLLNDFVRGEISRPATRVRRAKICTHKRTRPGWNADGAAIRLFRYYKEQAMFNQDRLNEIIVAQSKEKFLRRIF